MLSVYPNAVYLNCFTPIRSYKLQHNPIPRLPAELRAQIWEMTVVPRTVEINQSTHGGYHTVHLGDLLNNGRYKILHRIVWAARDQVAHTYIAVKISISEQRHQSREPTALRAIVAAQSSQPGYHHLMTMQDFFQPDSPNGTHDYLVLQLLEPSGPMLSMPDFVVLLGLSYLHEQQIGHDLHTRNIAFTIPSLLEEAFAQNLGTPEIERVQGHDRRPLEPCMPKYFVKPTIYPINPESPLDLIKIIDFGQSFSSSNNPHESLPVRAPKIIFKHNVDYYMNIWGMGCMLFELIFGQPLFDSFMTTPTILMHQMLEMSSDEEMYFDGERSEDLSHGDILRVGALIRRMLLFEPSARPSPREILQDP
ncbi:kinase-like domain-containing protein [Phaeosphaeriaceae sp. PMI808]|nr:kinase-like domain-containing protein [Phaeosphaeriaceae sp. PMI808]